jgi:phosphatidylinositol alpha-1,6-mannosyltransferase
VLTPDFPPAYGGIQLLVARLVEHLEKFDIRVVAFDGAGAESFDRAARASVRRVRRSAVPKASNLLLNARGIREGLAFRPDIVLSAHIIVAPAARAIRRATGTPYVQYLHGNEVAARPHLSRLAVTGAAANIAVSGYTAGLALAVGANPATIHRIPPGVDLRPPPDRPRDRRPTLLTVARLAARYKGHDVVMEALPRIKTSVPDAVWVIVGDGPLRGELVDLAAAHGVSDSVVFEGALPDDERDAWFDRAHVFVMPSRLPPEGAGGDGFGIVYLEAGAHLMPVVAGNVAGPVDAVADGQTGLLVDPTNHVEVADAVTELLRDSRKAEALGAAGAARVQEFAWPKIAAQVDQVLAEVLAGDRPRVVFVSDSEEFGGAELSLASLAEGMGGSFDLVALVGDRCAEETRRRLARAGARVRIIPGLRRRCTPAGFLRLLAAIRGERPELVHVNCSDQGGLMAPILAAWLLRRRALATVRLVSPGRARWRERLSSWILGRADAVIAVSDSVAAYLVRAGIQATVVYNGVSLPGQRPDARDSLGVGADAFVVGGLGRLDRQKGWDLLCRASALVRDEVPEAAFVVIGEGEERAALERLSECGSVRFAGHREDAAGLLPAFDVLVVPSRWEGFGRVAAEGMLAGVPVVASTVEGLPEVVGDCGVLVPPESPEALAEAVVALAKDPDRRAELATMGKRRAEERFGVEQMVERTRDVYARLGVPGRITQPAAETAHTPRRR